MPHRYKMRTQRQKNRNIIRGANYGTKEGPMLHGYDPFCISEWITDGEQGRNMLPRLDGYLIFMDRFAGVTRPFGRCYRNRLAGVTGPFWRYKEIFVDFAEPRYVALSGHFMGDYRQFGVNLQQ